MNDDLPPIFDALTPRPAPNELRNRVLAAVDEQLSLSSVGSSTNPQRKQGSVANSACDPASESARTLFSPLLTLRVTERAAELFVAASLVVGVGWNTWQWRTAPEWQARVFGAPAVPSAVVGLGEAVASVTDDEVARSIVERFGPSTSRAADVAAFRRQYQKLLDAVMLDKEPVL